MLAKLKQWFCSHAVYIDDISRPNKDKAAVIAPCFKCGKQLKAAYGLVLPATLHRKP